MSQGAVVKLLPLDEALTEWSDGQLLANVVRAERPFSPESLKARGRLHLGGARAEHTPGRYVAADHMRTESALLDTAWRELVGEFSRKIDREQLFLYGVPGAAQGEAERELIPNAFAADLEFDFVVGSAHRGTRRWVSVRCTTGRLDARPNSTDPVGSAQHEFRVEDLPALSDEMVLALLEEHARRVVESADAKLIAPGKISVMPIIRRKMEQRAASGEMLTRLAPECKFLERWIQDKVRSHQTPTAASIENALRSDYARLKP